MLTELYHDADLALLKKLEKKALLNDNHLNKSLIYNLTTRFRYLLKSYWSETINFSSFLNTYYLRNELLWVDGFLFDFLQKKTADLWIRKFVIFTGFLFSERLVFENVVRVYLDNIVWPANSYSLFESANVSELLSNVLFLYFIFVNVFFISYLIFLI